MNSESPTAVEFVRLPGFPDTPLTLAGKASLLVALLSREEQLPDCVLTGPVPDASEEPGMFYFNGHPAGRTEEDLVSYIWRMVEIFQAFWGAEGGIPGSGFQSVAIPGFEDTELNILGKTRLLVTILGRCGMLPISDVTIAGSDDLRHAGMYLIDGQPLGRTEEEVSSSVWRIVERRHLYTSSLWRVG